MPGDDCPCRLCGGATTVWARKRVLQRHDVAYYLCGRCGSLQTEPPYWLDEAYAFPGTGLDTGACQRCFDLVLKVDALLQLLHWPKDRPCLDFGAGHGVFARMMRDRGYDFYAHDKYVEPFYMDCFSVGEPSEVSPKLVTAFELVEHLPHPAEDLAAIFDAAPDIVLFSTELFQGQPQDWWYLSLEGGQHVFLYSPAALKHIADRYGYRVSTVVGLHVFLKSDHVARQAAARVDLDAAIRSAGDAKKFGALMMRLLQEHQQHPYDAAVRDMRKIEALRALAPDEG